MQIKYTFDLDLTVIQIRYTCRYTTGIQLLHGRWYTAGIQFLDVIKVYSQAKVYRGIQANRGTHMVYRTSQVYSNTWGIQRVYLYRA